MAPLDLGPYAGFIWAAYAVTALVVGALTCWILMSDRRQRKLLAALEAGGVRRRSDGRAATPQSAPAADGSRP